MGKAPDAFRTISEVAEWLDVAPHVLRFWESKFTQVKPVKRAGGRRYYRPGDMQLLGGIKVLLHDQGQTIKAVQSMIREEGVAAVSAHSPMIDGAEDVVEGTAEAVADDNVVAFEPAEPREAAPADEPHTEPASTEDAPSQEPAVADAAEDTAEPETTEPEQEIEEPEVAAAPAPKPLIIDIPEIASDTPDYAALPVSALSLSLQADKTRLASKAKEIAPLVSRLEALRAEMTAHGAR